jgi:hypothetical protein
MDQEQIKRIIEDTYDISREDTILSMAKDFYSRKMLSTAILVWAFGIIFFAGAAYCAMQFLKTDNTKSQIMYAAIFIPCVLGYWLHESLCLGDGPQTQHQARNKEAGASHR